MQTIDELLEQFQSISLQADTNQEMAEAIEHHAKRGWKIKAYSRHSDGTYYCRMERIKNNGGNKSDKRRAEFE